ncbi:MAG: protein translocase subunit SecD, partial [Actinomycetaceae bacterium]|nr:protein translocase subunit SecD [Actinomycetaceae bacterium]
TLNLVRTSAVLRMRPVLQQDMVTGAFEITDENGNPVEMQGTAEEAGDGASEEAQADAPADTTQDAQPTPSDTPATTPENASDPAWITEEVLNEYNALDCTKADTSIEVAKKDDPKKPLAACDMNGYYKYILGPAELEGADITNAVSGYSQRGESVVNIQFNSKGTKIFTDVTTRLVSLEEPRNQFAAVLDGSVVTAPRINEIIPGGSAEISGSFTPESAKTLANQLSFGSLPLHFDVESEEQISATLGSESLRAGLIAGLIGIILIILYLLWQYHGLGVIAIGSITLAVGLSYLIVSLLSYLIGMRLSLAGVVALIISIGITADSFIVFFERIRDEQREGRSNISAVSHGWERAKRTVIVADSVNLLAAVVLYFLAVGSVRGFAFTLGLTTILDLIIIFMFTYPAMYLLVRKTAFFGQGKRFSGMDSVALGNEAHYKGAGRFVSHTSKKDTVVDGDAAGDDSADEDDGTQEKGPKTSLARRRAVQRRKEREAQKASNSDEAEDVSAADDERASGREDI